ncbi:hypothetical protein AAE478_005461 [Parahypoxylon ruwenzoriense]
MPPKQSTAGARGRGAFSAASRPSKSNKNPGSRAQASASASSRAPQRHQPSQSDASDLDPFAEENEPRRPQEKKGRKRPQDNNRMDIDDEDQGGRRRREASDNGEEEEEQEEEARRTIPPELLTRILHEFFEKDGTRVSKDANAAVAKYMDIFVREAIARTVVEKEKGFLEVEDLEKVAPQLLLDL